ncbi:hypothetical protein BV20DRAFT_422678 [Pilatotrama ljubarskyi]|nr:hypothetical protein BV20DRAFT_422678 [Pilatotrama ljubarskyi]
MILGFQPRRVVAGAHAHVLVKGTSSCAPAAVRIIWKLDQYQYAKALLRVERKRSVHTHSRHTSSDPIDPRVVQVARTRTSCCGRPYACIKQSSAVAELCVSCNVSQFEAVHGECLPGEVHARTSGGRIGPSPFPAGAVALHDELLYWYLPTSGSTTLQSPRKAIFSSRKSISSEALSSGYIGVELPVRMSQ